MKTAAVSELKARLSKYLDRVKAGEEVLITDRGNPVARLTPIVRGKNLAANHRDHGKKRANKARLR